MSVEREKNELFMKYRFLIFCLLTFLQAEDMTLLAPDGSTIFIHRDDYGVPHIKADNEAALFFGQGFAEANDRLYQIDLNRRAATGRLAEWFGEVVLDVDKDVIRTKNKPFEKQGGLVSLFGNICPKGAILKRSAADKKLFEKTGKAFVFEDIKEMTKKIDDPNLNISKDDILVLKNIGPKTVYGMPEAGYLPIPKKILKSGVKDMIRISDGRMSGTAFGTIILHVAPESATGGPFSILKTGDKIKLSVKNKSLNVLLSKSELDKRLKNTKVIAPKIKRGYLKLYYDTVLQADEGCDFDFLKYKK